MLGAIIGDIAGSVYEINNIKTTRFSFFKKGCRPTDDSVMSIAVAEGFINAWDQDEDTVKKEIVRAMQRLGRRYPNAGYGGRFIRWLFEKKPEPYGSWGNGSAMRASSAGWLFNDPESVMKMAALSAAVTHDHPEGIKGAQAVAAAVFFARAHCDKEDIKAFIERKMGYDLDTPLDEIRSSYTFDVSCQGSVPQAIRAFLEACDYEQAVRLAISIGGDSDTIACMAGAIAEGYYGIPEEIKEEGLALMPEELRSALERYRQFYGAHCKRPDVIWKEKIREL